MDNAEGVFQLQKLRIGEVTSCDLSVNYLLAVGSRDKNVKILEWKIGLGFVDMFYSPLSFHKYAITSVRFSPKGTLLASASLDGTAVLTDVITGNVIFTAVQDNVSNIKFCEFTFDCTKLITSADDGVLCFWDISRHRQIRHCRLHENDFSLRGIAISPDSEYLLSTDSGNLMKLWFIGDVIHNQPLCFFKKKNIHDDVLCCDFSPVRNITGGLILKFHYSVATCSADGSIKVWDVIIERRENSEGNLEYFNCDLRLLHVLRHNNDILSVRFNPGGNYIVSAGLNNLVKLWEANAGRCLGTLQGHARYVTTAVFSKDSNLLATGSIDKTLIIWGLSKNLTLDSELLIPCNVSSHFTNINAVNYHVGNRATNQEKKHKEFIVLQKLSFPSVVNSIQFQGNDALAVAGGHRTLGIWKRETDKTRYEEKEAIREHECSVNHLDILPSGGKIISCSGDGMMILWDLNMSLTYKMNTPNCTGSLRTCKFSPDSKFIVAAGDDQKVYLWDANNLEFLKTMQQHEFTVTALAFTHDGEFLVSTCGNDIILQSSGHNKLTDRINNAHDLGVLCCDFSSASVLNTESTGVNINSSPCYRRNKGIYHLATGGNDSLVKLWEVSVAGILSSSVLSGHGGTVNYVKFASSDPFILASCSSDTTARIWNTYPPRKIFRDLITISKSLTDLLAIEFFLKKSKGCLHVLSYHQGAVTTCSFSKDSTLFATGSLDKSVLIFNLTTRFCHELQESDLNSSKLLENWTPSDIANWLLDTGNPDIADKIQATQFSGRKLLSISDSSIAHLFQLKSEKEQKELKAAFSVLKKSLGFPSYIPSKGKCVPHKFLCPITHTIMKDPVICADGYTYDRATITEWFLSGKLTSPVTKECLTTTKLLPYSALKINIHKFLNESDS